MNKLQWTFNRNPNIFIENMYLKMSFVCEMASILLGTNVLKVGEINLFGVPFLSSSIHGLDL